jgi:hypothetical protein
MRANPHSAPTKHQYLPPENTSIYTTSNSPAQKITEAGKKKPAAAPQAVEGEKKKSKRVRTLKGNLPFVYLLLGPQAALPDTGISTKAMAILDRISSNSDVETCCLLRVNDLVATREKFSPQCDSAIHPAWRVCQTCYFGRDEISDEILSR